jgi:hypothetical protein
VGLTDDQKAMLRLLAQREEGYEDMAALMGLSVEEVRERVKEALAEVGEEAPASPPPAVEPPAPPPPEPQPNPEPPPQPPAPPSPPAAPVEPPVAAPKPRAPRPPMRLPSLKLPKDRGALIGLGAGALALLALVIVLIVGGDGGGGGSSESATSGEGALAENVAAASENRNLTQAVLAPTNGGDAAGRAIFGRYKKKVLLQVTATGLEPSGKGQMYTVWLYRSPKIALQIGAVPVGESGKLAAQFEIPVQLLAYVANGAFDQVDVALTNTAEYKAAFAKAKGESKVPPYVGESALRGPITSPAIKKK